MAVRDGECCWLSVSLPGSGLAGLYCRSGFEQGISRMDVPRDSILLRIFIGESDRWQEKPLHEALVTAIRAHDLAGATVYRGISGYGAHRRVHKEKPFHLSRDNSIMLTVVDTEEKLKSFLPIVDQMVQEGLVVLSDVDIIKYAHRAETGDHEMDH